MDIFAVYSLTLRVWPEDKDRLQAITYKAIGRTLAKAKDQGPANSPKDSIWCQVSRLIL